MVKIDVGVIWKGVVMTGLVDGPILPIKEDVLGRKVIPSAVNNCHNTAYNDTVVMVLIVVIIIVIISEQPAVVD